MILGCDISHFKLIRSTKMSSSLYSEESALQMCLSESLGMTVDSAYAMSIAGKVKVMAQAKVSMCVFICVDFMLVVLLSRVTCPCSAQRRIAHINNTPKIRKIFQLFAKI